ncbi:epidermal growth factor-like protein 7 [Tachypleus tridentatus]|uniref:epidermal growth factor-like protein 7 n=1 Tax=Tachypleus tridentatus TaxID=6853 RepID=UPI003FD654EC
MCARSHVINTPVKRFESYRKPVYRSFTHACQSDATQTCKSYRILYETAYRSVYKAVPHTETVFECCPGWTRSSSSYDCTKAICSPGCKNGGTCVKPNHCICTSGWSGDTCETDVDECSKKVKSCEHDCINTPGSYRCQCHNGFILQSDAKSCRINLRDDPEYQRFLQGYQELNQRVFVLEKIQKKHNLTDLEHRIKKITESISFIKRNHASPSRGLEGTTQVLNYPFYGSPWERVHSLSEQISMLEERLEDCTCSQERRNSRRRPWM